jgi:hypothetical protein
MGTPRERWPIWTDGGTGSVMAGTVGPPSWVYRLADGWYLTVVPDGAGGMREERMASRPRSPDGFDIPPSWYRIVARLPDGPATDALVAEVKECDGRPDRDLIWRLASMVAADPDAPALLIADDVTIEVRTGWVGRPTKRRRIELRISFFL